MDRSVKLFLMGQQAERLKTNTCVLVFVVTVCPSFYQTIKSCVLCSLKHISLLTYFLRPSCTFSWLFQQMEDTTLKEICSVCVCVYLLATSGFSGCLCSLVDSARQWMAWSHTRLALWPSLQLSLDLQSEPEWDHEAARAQTSHITAIFLTPWSLPATYFLINLYNY